MIWFILAAVFLGILVLYQAGLLILGWLFLKDRPDEVTAPTEPATIIVALHNEAPNEQAAEALKSRMARVVNQDYPTFEVIFVNDRSTDHTGEILQQFAIDHPHVFVHHIEATPANASPKKWALRKAIEDARSDILAFTDADCIIHPFWLEYITRPLRHGKAIALGYSPPENTRSLLNAVQRFEAFCTAFLYLALARIGMPYMGVGRNIAWRKSLLDEPPFESHLNVLSGDDDLFINQYATDRNTGIVIRPYGHMPTLTATSWIDWMRSKMRHVSASRHYRLRNKLVVGLHGLALTGAYGFALATLWFYDFNQGAFMLVFTGALRTLSMLPAAIKLKFSYLFSFLVILDVLFVIYSLLIVPLGWLMKPVWQTKTINPRNAPLKTNV